MKNYILENPWKIMFGLWAIQGLLSLIWLLLIPTDAENGYWLGFTTSRLTLFGTTLSLIIVSAILFFYNYLPIQRFLDIKSYTSLWDSIYILSVVILFTSPVSIKILYSLQGGSQYLAYAQRLTPLATWFFLSAFELIIMIAYTRYKWHTEILQTLKPVWKKVIISLLILFIIVLTVAITKIGITPDLNTGRPGIPLLEWQVVLVFLIIFVSFFYFPNLIILDKWLMLCLYLFTLGLWLSQPINTAYTATPPRAPNFEIYPFSDPQIYVQYSQSALVGNGFLYPEVPSRPLYIAFLTWFHLFGKQDYTNVVIIQSLILAFFPVILYLIGKELGSRSLGFALAILLAFRDVNANIAVPFASNVTYSKLFLSEIPLALCISLIVLITIRWLKLKQNYIWMPLLIGSLLGSATLIRTQSISLIIVILFVAFLTIPNRRRFLKNILLISLALIFTITPWLTRNYIASGGLTLDNTISQVMTMALRWSGGTTNDEDFIRLEGESEAEFSSRMAQIAIVSFTKNPQRIIKTAVNHFINSEIVSLMILPLRNEIHSPSELISIERAFWGALKPNQLLIFFIYIILFGLGIAIAFHRYKWIGLFPLMLGLIYNAWTALFFSSGERFVAPLDWSVLLYQLLGLIGLGTLIFTFTQASTKVASFWTRKMSDAQQIPNFTDISSRPKIILTCIFMLVISLFTPLTEFVFPKRYQFTAPEEITQKTGIIPNETEVIISGRALYPRYYESGEGEPYTAKLGYGESETSRLVFFVVGTENSLVIFELESAPQFFPHASDVYLIGNWSEGYFSPRAAFVSKDGETVLYLAK